MMVKEINCVKGYSHKPLIVWVMEVVHGVLVSHDCVW